MTIKHMNSKEEFLEWTNEHNVDNYKKIKTVDPISLMPILILRRDDEEITIPYGLVKQENL